MMKMVERERWRVIKADTHKTPLSLSLSLSLSANGLKENRINSLLGRRIWTCSAASVIGHPSVRPISPLKDPPNRECLSSLLKPCKPEEEGDKPVKREMIYRIFVPYWQSVFFFHHNFQLSAGLRTRPKAASHGWCT